MLELQRAQLEKRIAFEDGWPVGCRSNLLHETLGRFLVEKGRITDAQCHEALAQAARDGAPLGEVLVTRGLLQPYDLFRAMQQNTARRILDCFTWKDARYRLTGEPADEETPLRMNPAQLILTAATTVLPFEIVTQALSFSARQRFALVASPPHDPAGLKLHTRDQRLLSLLRRRPSFEELTSTGLSQEEVLRRLYAFGVLGIVATAEAVPTTVAAPVVREPPPPPAPPPAPPSVEDDTSRLENEVVELFLRHRSLDAFDLLRVPPTATPPEIRRAWLDFAERVRPSRFHGALASVADKAEELFLAGARAYALLADYEQRNLAVERRWRREEEAKRRKGTAGADFRIKSDLLDAGGRFDDGLRHVERQEWTAAVNHLEFACDCDPGRARYRAWLGWALFRGSPGRADKALAELATAQRNDAACDEAFWFEGLIRSETGDLAGAEECFRRAVKANPSEKKYTEALKQAGLARRRA